MFTKSRTVLNLARHVFSSDSIAYLILFITARCNARCRMCFNWQTIENAARVSELSLEEIERLARSLPRLFQVVVSGGEPFLRDDIVEALELFRRYSGVSVVSIPTNASLTEKTVAAVERLCGKIPDTLVRINVSIDGIGAVHDAIRNVKGMYERAVETARRLIALKRKCPNLAVNVQSVLSSYNVGTIKEVYRTVTTELGPDLYGAGWPRGDLCEPNTGEIDFAVYEEVTDYLNRERMAARNSRKYPFAYFAPAVARCVTDILRESVRHNRWPIPCVAGRRMLVVRENADVLPCELLSYQIADPAKPAHKELASAVMGNLREADFNLREILNSPAARRILDFIATNRCPCTFECAIHASLLFNYKSYPLLLRRVLERNHGTSVPTLSQDSFVTY